MKVCKLKASDEVISILKSAAVIDDAGITLGGTLSRPEYVAVDKFLKLAGAIWNKKAKRHLFDKPESREKLESLLESGEIQNDKKTFQSFYTPTEIAKELVELADVCCGMDCLEPSAGDGAIADAMREAGGNVLCVELNPDAVKVLSGKGYIVHEADFLDFNDNHLDRIVMNPPFSNDQDIKHVLHAYNMLRPNGILVAIMSPGFTFGETKTRKAFREFLEDNGEIVKELPEGTFSESGTNVRTVIIKITKND